MTQPLPTPQPKIVVGVDGSSPAAHALHAAARMAGLLGARIEAVFAYTLPPAYTPLLVVSSDDMHATAREALREAVNDAFPDGAPTGTTLVAVPSNPAHAIMSRAHDAALVVVGSRGHGGITNLLLGSVAAKVVEHAPCPVLVVRPDTHLDLTPSRRVVVGVDGSPGSIAALRWAADLAGRTGSGLDAVMTFEPPVVYGYPVRLSPPNGLTEKDYLERLEGIIADVFGAARPPGLRLFAEQGYADERLVEHARAAELLVVGSRGLGGFAGLLLGSTSARCVQHSPCPVVVVHSAAASVAVPESAAARYVAAKEDGATAEVPA